MTALDPALADLARSYGVATEYSDWQGTPTRVPHETVVAILTALGLDVSTPEAMARAAEDRRLQPWRRVLPATVVARAGWAKDVPVHVPHGEAVEVWLQLEDGRRHPVEQQHHLVAPAEVDGRVIGEALFRIPSDVPAGYHTLHAKQRDLESTCRVIVSPQYVGLRPGLRDKQSWGFMVQLYQTRSERSWALGDLRDLRDLGAWSAAELGADLVLVNPLHAAVPGVPQMASPYSPSSRRFVHPTYLRIEDVPEYAYLDVEQRAAIEALAEPLRATNRDGDLLDRDAVWTAKIAALEILRRVPLSPARAVALAAYREREGTGLVDFATWCVLTEVHGQDWRDWPTELQRPDAPEVAAARVAHSDRVDLYAWIQWLLDEQAAAAQRAMVDAGMGIGVMTDLAVGVDAASGDAWLLQDALARGVLVGAPPDGFNQQGQNWGLPPWNPAGLAELGYEPLVQMLRAVMRHAGGLRVDHILGFFRLWWVPEGALASDGAYVYLDHEAMIGVLCLEAARAGCLLVGEDLGVVEPWVRDYMAERGILGTQVLWFEYADDEPARPRHYRELAMSTVTVHDLPPTAGYLQGVHVDLRHDLGLLANDYDDERAADERERGRVVQMLAEEGLIEDGAGEAEVVDGLHRFLARTPSRLLGVYLPDAVGDRRPQNQPGTSNEYPNWCIPLADGEGTPVLLDDLIVSERLRSLVDAVSSGGQAATGGRRDASRT